LDWGARSKKIDAIFTGIQGGERENIVFDKTAVS
jgi:hypothetical protein